MAAFDLDAWLASVPSLPAAPTAAPIVQAGATVLRQRAAEVPKALFGTSALERLAALMVKVMRAAPGVGLAAPQIDVPLRVFVAEDPEERMMHLPEETKATRGRAALPLLVIVNPTVRLVPGDTATFFEGCLSVRGYAALVRRAAVVDVTGFDLQGRPIERRLQGWPARIMQHEMDHLDGTLYIDRMITRSLVCDDEYSRWSALPVADVLRDLVGE